MMSLIAGEDYDALTSVGLTFTSTSLQRQCVDIGIINDETNEPVEQFFVLIAQIISQGSVTTQATVLITDGNTLLQSFINQ